MTTLFSNIIPKVTYMCLFISLLLIMTWRCSDQPNKKIEHTTDEQFDLPHLSGQAEISIYELEKSRYGEQRKGEAILIFVTEPFDKIKQVKPDAHEKPGMITVLKMNRIERFSTGIYDYSQFTSTFTPLSEHTPKYPLKITMSSQDWCGQSFYQLNNNAGFEILKRSYFEQQGDEQTSLDYATTEDNLFNLAKIDTALLPTGNFKILPSFSFISSQQVNLTLYTCEATLKIENESVYYEYSIPQLNKQVKIVIDPANHNRIERWEETYPSGKEKKPMTSTYKWKNTTYKAYWEMNANSFSSFRDSLHLLF